MYMHIHDSVVGTSDTEKAKDKTLRIMKTRQSMQGQERYTNGETKRNTNINKKKAEIYQGFFLM